MSFSRARSRSRSKQTWPNNKRAPQAHAGGAKSREETPEEGTAK